MPLPEKEYFALEEIALEEIEERWGIRRLDTIYYAENGLLKIAMRVVGITIETGLIEPEPDGRWFRLIEDQSHYSGLLTLRDFDLAMLLRRGAMTIHSFEAGEHRYGDILSPEGGIEVRAYDLVVTQAERDRFERAHRLGPEQTVTRQLLTDYRFVSASGRTFQLGTMQAEAIRILHDAAVAGTPWVHGKDVLRRVGAHSMRMVDLFKTQRHWRDLIASDGRGHYRLTASDLGSPSLPHSKEIVRCAGEPAQRRLPSRMR